METYTIIIPMVKLRMTIHGNESIEYIYMYTLYIYTNYKYEVLYQVIYYLNIKYLNSMMVNKYITYVVDFNIAHSHFFRPSRG